jgi:integrase/recombinase XerC
MPRPAGRPWYRRERDRWYYTTPDGRQTMIERDGVPVTGAGGRAEALAALREMLAEVVAPPDALPVRGGTIAAAAGDYLAVAKHRLAATTHAVYGDHLRWLVRRFGGRAVASLPAAEVEVAAAREAWADGTRRLCLSVVGRFMRWAGRERWKVHLPPAGSRGAEAVVSPDEFERLAAAAQGDFGPLLRLYRLSGCRPGEGRQLTAEAVDWGAGLASLKEHKNRSKGKSRVLYFGPAALAVLEAQRAKYGGGLLFRNRYGRMFSRKAAAKRMAVCRERAGVRGEITNYYMRHSFATAALEAGVSDTDVAALLGHSGTAMLHKVYAHVTANARRLRDIAARLDGAA